MFIIFKQKYTILGNIKTGNIKKCIFLIHKNLVDFYYVQYNNYGIVIILLIIIAIQEQPLKI